MSYIYFLTFKSDNAEQDALWNGENELQFDSEHQLETNDFITIALEDPEGQANLIEDFKTNRFQIIAREYFLGMAIGSTMNLVIRPVLH